MSLQKPWSWVSDRLLHSVEILNVPVISHCRSCCATTRYRRHASRSREKRKSVKIFNITTRDFLQTPTLRVTTRDDITCPAIKIFIFSRTRHDDKTTTMAVIPRKKL